MVGLTHLYTLLSSQCPGRLVCSGVGPTLRSPSFSGPEHKTHKIQKKKPKKTNKKTPACRHQLYIVKPNNTTIFMTSLVISPPSWHETVKINVSALSNPHSQRLHVAFGHRTFLNCSSINQHASI